MDSPRVTVLMSVYNGEKYLKEAIESILNQTFRDFEFIIINDGSTDGTPAILARYQQMDNRIMVYHQENRGLVASLNRGCQLAKGEYIARMDADDVSLPERLKKQVDFLDNHLEVGVLGTWIECIDDDGRPLGDLRTPTTPAMIRWFLLFENCLAHPSVIMRRDLIEQLGFYRPEALHAEDYDLWTRAYFVTHMANFPEILVRRRISGQGISSRHPQTQAQTAARIRLSMVEHLLASQITEEEIADIRQIFMGLPLARLEQIELVVNLTNQLYRTYLKTSSPSRLEARKVAKDASRRLFALALLARKFSVWKGLGIFAQSLRLDPPYVLYMSIQLLTRVVRTRYRKA